MTSTLDCDHCGGDAVTSASGLFGEGDADRCESCDIRGSIIVDEGDDEDEDGEPVSYAHWLSSDNSKCRDAECAECNQVTP